MSADRVLILTWLSDLASSIVTDDEDQMDVAGRITAAGDLGASEFSLEVMSLVRIVAENAVQPADFDKISAGVDATGQTLAAIKILMAIGLAISGGRIAWPSRPSARRARARISDAGDIALSAVATLGANGASAYAWLSTLVAVSCRLVSDIAANAAPIVRVSTGISMPSTVLAYRLYGDAKRAADLVEISGSSTPLVMPTRFDALGS